jgi:hypothetical protein
MTDDKASPERERGRLRSTRRCPGSERLRWDTRSEDAVAAEMVPARQESRGLTGFPGAFRLNRPWTSARNGDLASNPPPPQHAAQPPVSTRPLAIVSRGSPNGAPVPARPTACGHHLSIGWQSLRHLAETRAWPVAAFSPARRLTGQTNNGCDQADAVTVYAVSLAHLLAGAGEHGLGAPMEAR